MFDILQMEFMQNAVTAGLLVSIICGIIGTLVVVNRIVFLAGGVAHAAYGGIGLSFYLGIPYMIGALGFSLASAMIMALVTLKSKQRADTIIGVMWAFGMAMGIILLDLTPGYNVDLMSYLFGSILTVPASELWIMALLGGIVFVTVVFFYNDMLAMSYDEEFARIRGVPVTALYFLLIGLVAISVVMVIRVVGLIMVIALLTIPPYIAEKITHTLKSMMVLASLFGAVFTFLGLWLSYAFDLTSGAAIIMVASFAFFITMLIHHLIHLARGKQAPQDP